MTIAIAETAPDIESAFSVVRELRPHLDIGEFVQRVQRMSEQGYRLVCLRDGAEVVAVAGLRVWEQLSSGRVLYVDDLVTSAYARSQGHGANLLAWLREYGRAERCTCIELDSGIWRADAHRFYLREDFLMLGYHFQSRPLADGESECRALIP